MVLLTTWGGNDYAWGSPMIIGLGLLGAVTAPLFVLVERRVEEPILPLTLFANRNFSVSSAMGFFVGFSMFGATAFLPLYQQTVQGASATSSGLLLLPLMLGVMSMSVVSGQVISRTGHYRAFPIIGGAAMIVGMVLLAQLDASTSTLRSSLFMLVLGLGIGFVMQVTMLLPQNSVEQRDMGVASSTSMFTRSIGGAFGVAIFGAIFSAQLTAGLDRAGAGAPGWPAAPARSTPRRWSRFRRRCSTACSRRSPGRPPPCSAGPRSRPWQSSCSRSRSRRSHCAATTIVAASRRPSDGRRSSPLRRSTPRRVAYVAPARRGTRVG